MPHELKALEQSGFEEDLRRIPAVFRVSSDTDEYFTRLERRMHTLEVAYLKLFDLMSRRS